MLNMTQKQQTFLQCLLTESTVLKAAQKAGISRSTAYKYLNDAKFKACLDSARGECIHDTIRYLQGNFAKCSEELIKIIENSKTKDQIKINAINSVFMNGKALLDNFEIEERLKQLEEMLQEGEGKQ